jgi:hypothetical protein
MGTLELRPGDVKHLGDKTYLVTSVQSGRAKLREVDEDGIRTLWGVVEPSRESRWVRSCPPPGRPVPSCY